MHFARIFAGMFILISLASSNVLAQQIQSLSDLQNYKPREMVDFVGKCRLDLSTGFVPCNGSVSWVLGNRAASITFSKDDKMYVLTGIGDRQFDLKNYHQVVSTITEWRDLKPFKTNENLDGFCHFSLNKDATKFYFLKCTVNDNQNDEVYRFFLEDISNLKRQ